MPLDKAEPLQAADFGGKSHVAGVQRRRSLASSSARTSVQGRAADGLASWLIESGRRDGERLTHAAQNIAARDVGNSRVLSPVST